MTTFVALLRGINVGGHKKVAMADLRAMVTDLGFAGAQSLLQSGNLVFRGARRDPTQVERLLEAAAAKRLGLEADFVVRTPDEWDTIVERNPFRKEAARDPSHLLVMLLKDAPGAERVKALRSAIAGREIVQVDTRHAYLVYPDGIGRSRLTHTVIEKSLGTRGTARNWNTVLKLLTLVQG